jgi:ATP-dependent RNA helicase DDX49/DBP8
MALQNKDASTNKSEFKKPFVYRCDTGIATVATLQQRYLLIPSQVREVYLTLLLHGAMIKNDEVDEHKEIHPLLDVAKLSKNREKKIKQNNDKKRNKTTSDDPLATIPTPELEKIINQARSIIVFCNHCKTAQVLRTMLTELGISCAALHSLLSQRARLASLSQFKSRQIRVLIVTDVGSRQVSL